jgi:hypothetical protein
LTGGEVTPTPSASRALSIGRDEMAVMKDLTAALEKGQFKDAAEFERELKVQVEALKAKYGQK